MSNILIDAQRDAREFALAKMFYGEGAGNRRKLIQKTVDARINNPVYARIFRQELAKQDNLKLVKLARRERMLWDIKRVFADGGFPAPLTMLTVAVGAYALAKRGRANRPTTAPPQKQSA